MRIYVDCDDVISATGDGFIKLGKLMFDRVRSLEDITDFNLKNSFDLDDEQYMKFMFTSQQPDNLLSLGEIPGAVAVLNKWVDDGFEVEVVTGRPYSAYEATRKWLDMHNLSRLKLIHVDKYGRDEFFRTASNIGVEEFLTYHYDLCIDDSPYSFELLDKLKDCHVAVFDQPWNRNEKLNPAKFTRCLNWEDVDKLARKLASELR
ncbi:MAG: 2-dehydropantoate 2-reductase [Lachnospiraceae bacterium]|nr:2-dehydropantoate 2-reductase [Lachnospiraceae bacterium]